MSEVKSVIPVINPFEPPKDFVEWILSINKSWQDRIFYKPFQDYLDQCNEWLDEKVIVDHFPYESEEYKSTIRQEKERFKVNYLYYLNKYNYYKEAKAVGGRLKTTTSDSQDVMSFMLDTNISYMWAKARGIRASSTVLPFFGLKAKCVKNIHVKYVCSDDGKVKTLFDDKLKFSSQNDPDWMSVTVGSDRKDGYEYFINMGKGKKRGLNSKVTINPPAPDVVNGGNPDIVGIDEAPSIGIYDIMMQEARPALFTSDPVTNVRRMTKQLISWGSSQTEEGDEQVSDAFENDWKAAYDAWQKGDYSEGIVPVFFDCFAIPGFSKDEYDREKRVAENKGKESAIIRFRKHYPTCPDDVFLRNIDTIIPYEDIQSQLDKIYLAIKQKKLTLQHGYFEPIYDKNAPMPEGYVSPYRIKDVQFVPLSDSELNAATVTIFTHPDRNWINRYFQGTDPVKGYSGHSLFSSAIFDGCEKEVDNGEGMEKDYGKTIPAILSCRSMNYRYAYEQSYCLHLYYSNPAKFHFIPELLEINDGSEYNNYCEVMKFGYNMVANLDLPDYLQCGDQVIGINKRSVNAPKILNKSIEFFSSYIDRIFIDSIPKQLKTYVRHKNKSGMDSFSPATRNDFDDELDACTYAYIAYLCSNFIPKNIRMEAMNPIRKRRLVMKNGILQYEN